MIPHSGLLQYCTYTGRPHKLKICLISQFEYLRQTLNILSPADMGRMMQGGLVDQLRQIENLAGMPLPNLNDHFGHDSLGESTSGDEMDEDEEDDDEDDEEYEDDDEEEEDEDASE